MPHPDDTLSAALEPIRSRGYENGAHGARAAYLSDAAAVDIPRLLAALDVVAKRHYPAGAAGWCVVCAEPYPCNEVQDVTAALLREGDAAPADPPRPEPFRRPEGCICLMFSDTGGVRIADLTCPVHGVGGTDPGDGNWEVNTGG